MEITNQYTKVRSTFGRQPMFCELGPEMCDSIPVKEKEQKLYILRNPVHQSTQNTPCFSVNDINTIREEYSSSGANHVEGGWPKEVSVIDPEATQRYRRKIEKDDAYIHCVQSLSGEMEHCVLQNNAVDIYEKYYTDMSALPPVERNSMRTVNVYRDPTAPGDGRPVSSVAWDPEGHHFVATYVDVDVNRTPRGSLSAFFWDLENANQALLEIIPPCPLLDLQYNSRDHNTLAGGLMNGQVAIWDRRMGGPPVNMCPPHVAHRDLVRNVIFIASKSGQEFFSAGPDGACKWWDCRNMNEFTDEMIIDLVKSANEVPNMARSIGISVLEYENAISTKFMVGTENGLVICGNRKGKTAMDKLPAKYDAHLGPVRALRRNPNFLKNFLTVGDWTARVWSEDCRESSVIFSPPQRHNITDGDWSSTRISLMLLTHWDGLVSAWDLMRRQHKPTLAMQVCEEPLLRVTVHHAMLEREAKREHILEARQREIRLKIRQAEEGSLTHSIGEPDPAAGDRDLHEATTEYYAAVKKEMANI